MAGWHEEKPVVLDTPEQIGGFVLLQIYYRLKLEVENPGGPRWRVSPMKQAIAAMASAGIECKSRVKKKVLAQYEQVLKDARILS